jgi:hypothetical protein
MENNISDTPIQSQTSSQNVGTGLTITFTGLSTNNIGICAQTNATASTVITWTNATENYDVSLGAFTQQSSGADFITTSAGNRAVSTSHTNSVGSSLVGTIWG